MSDDVGVRRRGSSAEAEIKEAMQKLNCPFELSVLRKWAHNMVLSGFTEVWPDKFYRDPTRTKYIAPTSRQDLITQEEFDQVEAWMNEESDGPSSND